MKPNFVAMNILNQNYMKPIWKIRTKPVVVEDGVEGAGVAVDKELVVRKTA